MAGESQLPPKTEPDPSVAAYDALDRLRRELKEFIHGEIAVLGERLNGMDKATDLLSDTVNRAPTDLQKATAQLTQVMDEKFAKVVEVANEKFASVDTQFAASDKAVAAAFQAQEKQATASEVANQKAIDKSEKATNETITKNADAAEARSKAQDDKIDDLKERITRAEAAKLGGREATHDRRDNTAAIYGTIAIVVTLVLAVVTIVGFIIGTQ